MCQLKKITFAPVRNPLDCLYSYWQFREAWKHRKSGINVHTARIDVSLGETDEQMADIKLLTARWMEFNELWHQLSVPVHLIRYEDLRTSPLSMLMNLVNFLLPDEEEQPSMEKLSCALELDEEHEAYHSAFFFSIKSLQLSSCKARDLT